MKSCGNIRPYRDGCWIGGTDQGNPEWDKRFRWVDDSPWDFESWVVHSHENSEPNNDFCKDGSGKLCKYGETADCAYIEISRL